MKKFKKNLLEILLVSTVIALPLYVVRCSYDSFCYSPLPFTLLEILILSTFFAWVFGKITQKKAKGIFLELKKSITKRYWIAILSFLFFAGVATITSVSFIPAFGHFRAFFLEPFLLFIVIIDFLRVSKNYKLILYSLMISGLWVSLLAIAEKLIGVNPGNPIEFAERGRVSAVYTSSNAIGLYLGPITTITFGYLLYIVRGQVSDFLKSSENKLILAIFLLFLGGHIASGSRGAYVGLFVAFSFIFLVFFFNKLASNSRKKLIYLTIPTIILIFLSYFFLLFNSGNLVKNEFVRERIAGITPRLCIWEGTVNLIKERPILGTGLRSFREIYPEFKTCNQEVAIYPHNIFLNFWTELGLFGLISFLLLVGLIFTDLLRKSNKNLLNLALAGYFLFIFIHGLFDVPYFNNDLSAQFWVVLALSIFEIGES